MPRFRKAALEIANEYAKQLRRITVPRQLARETPSAGAMFAIRSWPVVLDEIAGFRAEGLHDAAARCRHSGRVSGLVRRRGTSGVAALGLGRCPRRSRPRFGSRRLAVAASLWVAFPSYAYRPGELATSDA
jgi:hypothetical protein